MTDFDSRTVVDNAFKSHKAAKRLLETVGFERIRSQDVRVMIAWALVGSVALSIFAMFFIAKEGNNPLSELNCFRLPNDRFICRAVTAIEARSGALAWLQSWNWEANLPLFITTLTAAMLFVGIKQWAVGNRHLTFDLAFDRKNKTNDLILNCRVELKAMLTGVIEPSQQESIVPIMFVFSELDNLEYRIREVSRRAPFGKAGTPRGPHFSFTLPGRGVSAFGVSASREGPLSHGVPRSSQDNRRMYLDACHDRFPEARRRRSRQHVDDIDRREYG